MSGTKDGWRNLCAPVPNALADRIEELAGRSTAEFMRGLILKALPADEREHYREMCAGRRSNRSRASNRQPVTVPPEIHRQIVAGLKDRQQVSYLAIKFRLPYRVVQQIREAECNP